MILFKRIPLLILLVSFAYTQNHVLQLDGVDDYVIFPNLIIQTESFAIEAWVFMSGPGGGAENRSTIFEQRDDQAGCSHSGITFFSETRSVERTARFGLRASQDCSVGVFAPSCEYGEWHHYVAVKDGNYSHVYIDGELRSSLWYDHQGDFTSYISHTTLGRQYHSGSGTGYLYGMMDEVKIWDYARSDAEILASMEEQLSGQEQGLLAYWDFEDSSDMALDKSYHGHNGSLVSGAEIIAAEILQPHSDAWGDLNQDGHVNVSDVIVLINHILGVFN